MNHCELCNILFPDSKKNDYVNNKESMSAETLYKILRDEMLHSFTRVANARNWVLIVLAGALGSVNELQSNGVDNTDAINISFILLGATLFTLLFSHFACIANSDISDLGMRLLSLESLNNNHNWNEHFCWFERLKSRKISDRKSWLIYRKNKFEINLHHIKYYIYDFYFWISGILLTLQFIHYSYHLALNILQVILFINILLFIFILLITFSSTQNTFYYLKNSGLYYYQLLNVGHIRTKRSSKCFLT